MTVVKHLEDDVQYLIDCGPRGRDPEAEHVLEDNLLWEYVRLRAVSGDAHAKLLLRIEQENDDRTRWYA